ncbi:putative Up-regulated during septation-domain-containing protein [Seiridium cardinale]|uniref:Up-regulated during septation-domain-containing protein n=1 Tax=Seiridium cardinale TaxID=138064 RepID=A0ABR2XYR7_9PEZI
MNGIPGRGMNGFDGRPQLLRPLGAPSGPTLVDGYRQDAINHFQREKPRFNPMNAERMQSSVLVDLKDPVQVHLLTETALYDSKEYEVLSQEEVDDLKKQVRVLNQMIEQTRSNLAVQSKYRDAAISMARLYSPAAGKRKSLLGNRNSSSSSASEVEAERDAIQKRCEELASELWVLERRIMEPQRRLLEHTAGILQMTHKSPGKNRKTGTPTTRAPLVNGIPASPESMYTTTNGRNSMEPDDVPLFDEDSWTRTFDDALNFASTRPKKNIIEIPLKSPVREQHKQLTEESERLREENIALKKETDLLRRQTTSLTAELEELKQEGTDQWRLISDTERKLEVFNNQLRQVIVRADPVKNGNYGNPPSGRLEPGDLINSHLDYLEKAVIAVGDDSGNSREATETVHSLNGRVQELLLSNDANGYPDPPVPDTGFEEQVNYLYDALSAAEAVLRTANDRALAGAADRQKSEQNEAILLGLWDIIQSGYADIQQRNQDRRKTRVDKGLQPEDDDMSDTETFDTNEDYSISAFSTRVQWLYAEATKLKEQKAVLKRQIKQQRELNNKSDTEKDEALQTKEAELEESRGALVRLEREADDVRRQLSDALANHETTQNNVAQASQEQSAAVREAQTLLKERDTLLKERNSQLSALEANTQDMQMRLSAAEANIATITAQLREANNAKSEADKVVEAKEKEIKEKQDELDEMTGMVAEYKMEATFAKAELDGAYGSRRERAKDAAAFYNSAETAKLQAKVERLQPRINDLEKELKGTVQDLKDITKQAIEAETKIADLESELDKASQQARRDKEQLQDALDQERLKATAMPLSPSGRPNASILTDSYRDALRSERKKHEEQLRNEQMSRRKIEEELRQLRRAMGPGKSPLSPR